MNIPDFLERQMGDVDQPIRLFDIVFHQVDEICPAGDELRS